MAKFRVAASTYVNDRLVPAGQIIDYEVPAGTKIGPNLIPVKPGVSAEQAEADLAKAQAELAELGMV